MTGSLTSPISTEEYTEDLLLTTQILGTAPVLAYIPLQYLRTNGGYILLPNTTDYSNTSMEIKYALTASGGQNVFFQGNTVGIQTSNSTYILARYGSSTDKDTGALGSIAIPVKVKIAPTEILVNDIQTNTYTASSGTNSNDICISAFYNSGSPFTSDICIYEFNVWSSATLTHNLIPVIKKSDELVYLYDTVTDTYYRHADFTAGPEK